MLKWVLLKFTELADRHQDSLHSGGAWPNPGTDARQSFVRFDPDNPQTGLFSQKGAENLHEEWDPGSSSGH